MITGLHCFLQLNAGSGEEGGEIADALKELETWKVGLALAHISQWCFPMLELIYGCLRLAVTLYVLKGKVEEATCVKADLALEATKQEEAKTKAKKDMNAALEQQNTYREECTKATFAIEVSLL